MPGLAAVRIPAYTTNLALRHCPGARPPTDGAQYAAPALEAVGQELTHLRARLNRADERHRDDGGNEHASDLVSDHDIPPRRRGYTSPPRMTRPYHQGSTGSASPRARGSPSPLARRSRQQRAPRRWTLALDLPGYRTDTRAQSPMRLSPPAGRAPSRSP